MTAATDNIDAAREILVALGMPRAQQNDRTALCLLALLDLGPSKTWTDGDSPLMGITPIMLWAKDQYGREYAPNTRETFRRHSVQQFVDAGIALYNPDGPSRPVNSPRAVYQIAPEALALLRSYGTTAWGGNLATYLAERETLAAHYAAARQQKRVPVRVADGKHVTLSPGKHSELIRAIVEDFASRFAPGAALVYVGDTGTKWGYFDKEILKLIGVQIGSHGKMPDVVLYDARRRWLFLVESVTSHGPVDGKRHDELSHLFGDSEAGIVYVTAFPSRSVMVRWLDVLAWETEVWCADAPSHLIHFNGDRFLGPR